jgi:hypothetical protein
MLDHGDAVKPVSSVDDGLSLWNDSGAYGANRLAAAEQRAVRSLTP